jgi:hypothetical protein
MKKLLRSPKVIGLIGVCGVLLATAGWVVASAATSSTPSTVLSNTAPYPNGFTAPAGKTPLPSARVSPPAASVLPSPSDSGLSDSDAQCGGAPSCQLQGIVPSSQAPFSNQVFQVTNEYFGTYDGREVSIYAGASMEPSPSSGNAVSGGGVRVVVGGGNVEQYLAPSASTALTLTSADASANTVTLQDADGASYTFDFATDAFS